MLVLALVLLVLVLVLIVVLIVVLVAVAVVAVEGRTRGAAHADTMPIQERRGDNTPHVNKSY